MATLNPYLNFDGNAAQAMTYYKTVFGTEFLDEGFYYMKDVPGSEHLTEEERHRIMHVALPVGDSVVMASDIITSMGHSFQPGNTNYIFFNADSKAEADRVFQQLSTNGHVELPMSEQFWGDYYGSLRDQFGVYWMVNYHPH